MSAANELDHDALASLCSSSPWLGRRAKDLRRAALSEATMLVLGEAGTGRTQLARALHGASSRAQSVLAEIDVAGLPADLFEAELFGWRRGAFTTAERDQKGRIEAAEGGTLLIEHVEALPLAVQPKLLRLLDDRQYFPLGGEERALDARFVATGSHDLRERVERGFFRRDLFHRLEVFVFELEPLRRRPDDVPHLADALLADLARRYGKPRPRLTAGSLAWMTAHPWPGNLRELRNLLERAIVLAEDGPQEDGWLLDAAPPAAGSVRTTTLAELEATAIREVLAKTRGRQGEAAMLLGISRKSLWERRKRWGIP